MIYVSKFLKYNITAIEKKIEIKLQKSIEIDRTKN